MEIELTLILETLILFNTIAIIFAISAVSLMVTRMWGQLNLIGDLKTNIAELTKVIEQQTRLLEYIGKKFG